jgi:hypothetical protein
MKTMMTWLLALAMALLSGVAFANAKVHSMTGNVSAAVGPAPAQPVKVGDTIPAGQTVVTAANSTVVLQFPDGQITALTPNTRMTIDAYQFNEQQKSGNILLSLVSGGMRAITGLIGRNSPDKVAYKAATATIGIRGTDVTVALDGGRVVVVVSGGSVTFTVAGGTPFTIPSGSGVTASATATGVVTLNVQSLSALLTQLPASLRNDVATALSPGTTATLNSATTSNTSAVGTSSTVTTTTTGGGREVTFTPPPTPPKSQ